MKRSWRRTAGTLMGLQVVMGGLAYFLFDHAWLARAVGLLFLLALWQVAAAGLRGGRKRDAWMTALLFQLPGVIGTLNVLLEQLRVYKQNSLLDIVDFLMETWHSVLLPWLTLLPDRLVLTRSGEELVTFFLALPFLSPLLIGWVLWAANGKMTRTVSH